MHSTTRLQLRELNPHLLCVLCGGYLIDATTIIECIHSFCRTCIIRYLESSKYCPICDVQVHKTKPLLNVRSDKTLQTLVYKLVPSLFKEEMRRRREFYAAHPDQGIQSTLSLNASELRGEVEVGDDINTKRDEEQISLCLQSCAKLPPYHNEHLCAGRSSDNGQILDRRYLLCPSSVTIGHLKKLIRLKFDLPPTYRVDIFYSDEGLRDSYTLLDVAHIYAWRRVEPLKLYYIMHDRSLSQLHLSPPSVKSVSRQSRDSRVLNKRGLSLYTIRMSVSDTENTPDSQVKNDQNTAELVATGTEPGNQSPTTERSAQSPTVRGDSKEDVVSGVSDVGGEGVTLIPDDGGGGGSSGKEGNESGSPTPDVSATNNGGDDVRDDDDDVDKRLANGDGAQGVRDINENDKYSTPVGALSADSEAVNDDRKQCGARDQSGAEEKTDDVVDRQADEQLAETAVSDNSCLDNRIKENGGETPASGTLSGDTRCHHGNGVCTTGATPDRTASPGNNNNNHNNNNNSNNNSSTPTPHSTATATTAATPAGPTPAGPTPTGPAHSATPPNGRLTQADVKKMALLPQCFANGGSPAPRWLLPNNFSNQQCLRHHQHHHQRSPSPHYVTMASGHQYPVLFVGTTDTVCPVTFSPGGVPVLANGNQQRYFIPHNNNHNNNNSNSNNGHVIGTRPPVSAHACDSSMAASGTAAKLAAKSGELNGDVISRNGHQRATLWKKNAPPSPAVGGDRAKSDDVGLKLANGREPLCKLNRKRNRREDGADCKPAKLARANITGYSTADNKEELRNGNMAVTSVSVENHVTPNHVTPNA